MFSWKVGREAAASQKMICILERDLDRVMNQVNGSFIYPLILSMCCLLICHNYLMHLCIIHLSNNSCAYFGSLIITTVCFYCLY